MRISAGKKDFLAFALVVVLSAITCAIVFNNFVLPRGQMMWDEAEHALTGLVFANDIIRLDLFSLGAQAYQQILWPPLHPLLLSLFYLVFGQSITVARAFSLALYFLFSLSMYFLGREIVKKDKRISGVLCSVFALVTGSLYLSASEVMLEMLALLFFTLSLLFFLRFIRDRKQWWPVPIFVLLTFFSKTNFGLTLILAIAIFFLVRERFRVRSLIRNRSFLLILGPALIVIAAWLLIPPDRLLTFLGFLVNRPEGPPPLSLEGLLFYPIELYIYSGILIFVYGAALVLSFRHLKDEKIRFLVITALLVILLNFFHQNKKIRYILYLYPPLFSLASFHLTNLYGRIRRKRKELVFFLAVIASMALFLLYIAGNVRLYGYSFSVTGPLDFIRNGTQGSQNMFVLGEFNEMSPGLITWELSSISSIRNITMSTYSSWEFERPGAGRPDAQSMEEFISRHNFDTIVLIRLDNDSIFYNTEDYLSFNKWKLDYIPIVLENRNYSIKESRFFADTQVEITILTQSS